MFIQLLNMLIELLKEVILFQKSPETLTTVLPVLSDRLTRCKFSFDGLQFFLVRQ